MMSSEKDVNIIKKPLIAGKIGDKEFKTKADLQEQLDKDKAAFLAKGEKIEQVGVLTNREMINKIKTKAIDGTFLVGGGDATQS